MIHPQTPLRSEPVGNLGMIGIEDVLVTMIKEIVAPFRLDTEAINEIPDAPLSDEERAQSLEGKVPPAVFAGYIPLTITGEIIPDVVRIPSVTVQSQEAVYGWDGGNGTVRILVAAYSQGQDRQGYRDVINLTERITFELWRRLVIDQTAAIAASAVNANPVSWRVVPNDELNIFYGMITAVFELQTPTPDMHVTQAFPWIPKP